MAMNTCSPMVSFVIPTYNRANVISKCFDSVVNQTYKNIEIVVINDKSTDNTTDILKEYCRRYSFFRYYTNDGKGPSSARNMGIEKAKGEYIAFMDDDDLCESFRIEEQMQPVIESNFKYDFIISRFYAYDSEGKKPRITDYPRSIDSIGFTQRWLVKKDLLLECGGFDAEQPNLEEIELFWRLKNIAKIYFQPKPVVKVSNLPVSLTKDNSKMISGILRLLKLHGNKMSNFEKNIWLITLFKKYALMDQWEESGKYFTSINKLRVPFSSIFLYIAYLLKDSYLLSIHSRLQREYFKFRDFRYKLVKKLRQ
jgi:glycosyltransferase involved in cell wall biosynthesis